jgi:hypothetical protein
MLARKAYGEAMKWGVKTAVKMKVEMYVTELVGDAVAGAARHMGASEEQIAAGQRVYGAMSLIYQAGKSRCFAAGTQIAIRDDQEESSTIAVLASGAVLIGMMGGMAGPRRAPRRFNDEDYENIPDSHRGQMYLNDSDGDSLFGTYSDAETMP